MFEKIDSYYQELQALPPLSAGAAERILEDFTVRYTYNSNAIEGSTLTEQDTYMVLNSDTAIPNKPLRHHLEAIGHRDAFLYVLEQAQKQVELNEEFIKTVHAHVLMHQVEDRGHYRDVNVYISGADVVLPSAKTVPAEMQRLIAKYNTVMQNWHVVQRAAIFHLNFESIHPFIDGNGRTGRLLANFELIKAGYPPIDIKFTDKARYYHCLQSYQGVDEMELPMIYMFAEYVENAIREQISLREQARDNIRERNQHER